MLTQTHLIAPQTLSWSLAGTATHTAFDGFSLFHTERAAEAALDQAVATSRLNSGRCRRPPELA